MCGIFGFTRKDKRLAIELSKMLKHRGPDQEGIEVFENLTLGFRRLAIQDLSSKGNQPMFNKKRTCSIVFNGEIFNFKELRSDLIKKGYTFKSKTDTEVVLNSYLEYGEDCINKFNGQFAICIYDIKKDILFFARDRLGIKPLYYINTKSNFMFSSEIKAILKSKFITKKINNEQVNHYFHYGFTSSDKTIFKNIYKFPPGYIGIYYLKNKKFKITKYWDLKNTSQKSNITISEAKKELLLKLKKSIEYRIISDRPVGAFLSGGLDSSLIVALASKKIPNLHTFSVTFKNHKSYDESKYAKRVSEIFNTTHHELLFESNDVIKLLNETCTYYDEPLADTTVIPSYLVSKIAKKNVDVCLSGTGADELFFGYKRYYHFKILSQFHKMPSIIKTPFKYLVNIGKSKNRLLSKLSPLLEEKELYKIYSKLFTTTFCPKLKKINKNYFKYDNEHDANYFDIKEYLPSDLLYKEDIAGMASSLEGRFPFLDHGIVEFAFNLPTKLKLRKNEPKYILKKTAEMILPKDIIYRKKQSFEVPFKEYFRNELKEFTYKEIKEFNTLNLMNKNIMENLWRKHQAYEEDYSEIIFRVLIFNIWYKKWFFN